MPNNKLKKYKIKARHAQSALEFTMITGMMLLIFSLTIIVLSNKSMQAKREQDKQSLEDVASVVVDEINLAVFSEDGYTRQFDVPDALNGINFSIILLVDPVASNHSELVVRAENYSYSIEAVKIVPQYLTGQLYKGRNTIAKRNNTICINKAGCP